MKEEVVNLKEEIKMFTNYMLDAVQGITKAYIFYFIIILIIPFIKAGIEIYRMIKVNMVKKSEIPVNYDYVNTTSDNNNYNDLLLIRNKLRAKQPLSPYDRDVLRRYGILK